MCLKTSWFIHRERKKDYLYGTTFIFEKSYSHTNNNPLCMIIVTLTALQKPFNLHVNYFMQTSINNLILGVIVIWPFLIYVQDLNVIVHTRCKFANNEWLKNFRLLFFIFIICLSSIHELMDYILFDTLFNKSIKDIISRVYFNQKFIQNVDHR